MSIHNRSNDFPKRCFAPKKEKGYEKKIYATYLKTNAERYNEFMSSHCETQVPNETGFFTQSHGDAFKYCM